MWKVTMLCEMWWCRIVVMKNVAYMQCAVMWRQMCKTMQRVVMSDVVVWCKIKMSLVVCDVEYGVVWNILCCRMWVWCGIIVDVESREMWTVAAWCGTCDLRCGEVKWWCRGRLQCNVISDIDRWSEARCVATLWDVACDMWYVVMWCRMVWCGVKGGVM